LTLAGAYTFLLMMHYPFVFFLFGHVAGVGDARVARSEDIGVLSGERVAVTVEPAGASSSYVYTARKEATITVSKTVDATARSEKSMSPQEDALTTVSQVGTPPSVASVAPAAPAMTETDPAGPQSAAANCVDSADATWALPGGVSAGASFCIKKFVELDKAGKNAYSLIDSPLTSSVQRIQLDHVVSLAWHAEVNSKATNGAGNSGGYKGARFPGLDRAEWIVPVGYRQREKEVRLVYVHGSDSGESALGAHYAGLTTRLSNWTQMPLFAFNYASEPLDPWPQNIRNVFSYVSYALHFGHESSGRASQLIFVGDSEGTLVVMQSVLAAMDPTLLVQWGYGEDLKDPHGWLGGVVLLSPVVDVACETPSMEWNCYDEVHDTGDPDTGNCTRTPTALDRKADCMWSYLVYHFGLHGLQLGSNADPTTTIAQWEHRRDFFEQGLINPLRANLSGLPPLLLVGGVRDYYYSDSPRLAALACMAGVDIETFHAVGVYHDFIEYSEGCGGPSPMEEALEAYRRIQAFTTSRTKSEIVRRHVQ
jgi:acetyl esterase/lipase